MKLYLKSFSGITVVMLALCPTAHFQEKEAAQALAGAAAESRPDFAPDIPSKWISADGTSFYLLYSCIPNGPYQFNLQRCSLTLKPQ